MPEPTIGEVYRIALEIREDVKATNGAVAGLKEKQLRLEGAFSAIKGMYLVLIALMTIGIGVAGVVLVAVIGG